MTKSFSNILYIQSGRLDFQPPDESASMEDHEIPQDDFVLCRNKDGVATAVYGSGDWDFNPYRLSAKKIAVIRFKSIFHDAQPDQSDLIKEVKFILYCFMYFVGTGRVGKLSAVVIYQYFNRLASAARFCYDQKNKPLVGLISLRQLFTTPSYLAAFIVASKDNKTFAYRFPSMLKNLIAIGSQRLGYQVLDYTGLEFGSVSATRQTPVVPIRIYLELINSSGAQLRKMYECSDGIENFIGEFVDRYYAISLPCNEVAVGKGSQRASNFDEALAQHGLKELFSGDYRCACRRGLSMALLSMQFLLKTIIHLYTGMRDQEVLRLKYECLGQELVVDETTDEMGKVMDERRVICILSTTTKFAGFRKSESWLAPEEVVKAIKVAQAIHRGLSRIYDVKNKESPDVLFLNPSIVVRESSAGVPNLIRTNVRTSWLDGTCMTADDLRDLKQSDPSRNFEGESEFQVGCVWPLASHQFRRSLAFYASNSGFVSLPTLCAQFKHVTLEMSRYYRNGFERLKTIFGYFDRNLKEFVLPATHVAFEFQMAISTDRAHQLIGAFMAGEGMLFGGTGGFMQKQRARALSDDFSIVELKNDTLRRVRDGEINCRPTLLGNCTKRGPCDELLLGDYIHCVDCKNSIIYPHKVGEVIFKVESELTTYTEGSCEYQILSDEHLRLKALQSRIAKLVGGKNEK